MGNEKDNVLNYYKEKIIDNISKCNNFECLVYLEKFSRLLIEKKQKEEQVQ